MAADRKICVSIGGGTVKACLATAKKIESLADVIEIRLDAIKRPELEPFCHSLQKPLLFTCRPAWEGGFFAGSEQERVTLLLDAIKCQAAYVDIELKTEANLRQQVISAASKSGTRVIVSWHEFAGTPSSQALLSILQEQYRTGAPIGKIVTLANSSADVLRVLNLQIEAGELDFPLIAFCMGEAGRISRVATLELGGYMTYAAPGKGKGTAPGQLTAKALRSMIEHL